MTVFDRFLSLDFEDKKLLLKIFFLNYYVRLITWILPFPKVRRITQKMGKKHQSKKLDLKRMLWAVNVTSNYVFRSTCLTRALTGQILLEQQGFESTLRIGVMNDGKFEAHAWLEHDKEVVLGQSEKEFMPLVDFQ